MSPRRDWLAGLIIGVWAGFLLIYGPVVGFLLVLGFAILAAIERSLAAIGGVLLGAGAVILLMLALANWNCIGIYGLDDGVCTPPDLTGFLIEASAMALGGGLVTFLALTASRRAGARRP